jgi:hypothetical protein
MKKDKSWEVDVDLKFTQVVFAPTKAKAISQVKASFDDEYNLQPEDNEIVAVREQKE